uniref:hypothetical protein n=1 Tax=Candidatus Enterococcus willemsii TaxID=1857215 RepID=UPI00403F6605
MKNKSIYSNFKWVAWLLIGMGVLFLVPAIVMQFVPIGPDNFNLTLNGVRQPYTEANAALFRRIFLYAFSAPTLILFIIGGVILFYHIRKTKKENDLREMGTYLIAGNLEVGYSSIRVNYRHQIFLTCSYVDEKGNNYLFKSRPLRYDPRAFLNGQVKVYYQPDNISNYFVDVEGSMDSVYE